MRCDAVFLTFCYCCCSFLLALIYLMLLFNLKINYVQVTDTYIYALPYLQYSFYRTFYFGKHFQLIFDAFPLLGALAFKGLHHISCRLGFLLTYNFVLIYIFLLKFFDYFANRRLFYFLFRKLFVCIHIECTLLTIFDYGQRCIGL